MAPTQAMKGRRAQWALCSAALFLAVLLAYSNHFENGFHFDDANTILDNAYVRDLKNIPRFFVDPTTFSTLPDHHIYRPITSATLAIDYWLGGGAKPFYFHASTFLWFLLQLLLMFFLFRRLMDMADPHPVNFWVALAAAALYGLHPANAETVNYINQRADLFCTLGTVASVLWFAARPAQRKRGLYLIPAVVAFFAKPPVLIFPFVFLYEFLFEQGGALTLEDWRRNRQKWIVSFRDTAPALVAMVISVAVAGLMTPRTFNPGAASPSLYRLTQPWIALHYFKSFFLPTELSADSDWGYVTGPFSGEALLGYAFVVALTAAAVKTSRQRETQPIAFGIAWFFLALLPTSLVPLAEVTNDHRMFFPFVGLALAVPWAVRLAVLHASLLRRRIAIAGTAVALVAAAIGTHQRNDVWHTDESLWRDVVEKSPRNGRGIMNYGLVFMQRGDYPAALGYFERARPLTPNYWALETNTAIAQGALGNPDAERHFRRSLTLAPELADPHFFYARWLDQVGRPGDAVAELRTALRLNPQALDAQSLLASIERRPSAQLLPTGLGGGAEARLELSHELYRMGRYQDSIAAARSALEVRPDYAEAYNNIAAAYNSLGKWDEGIAAASEAVRLRPDFELARNNLAWAVAQKKRPAK